MPHPDFNLLLTLDAVLTEGSVAGSARRLALSPSAMSRALARLRETTGDPLLVRAGRGLVPTPRAQQLRQLVPQLVLDAEAVLRPAEKLDIQKLHRTFRLRTREGFVETYGPALIHRVNQEAPNIRLCFLPKPNKESAALREGTVDLETGVVGPATSPELRAQTLFRDRYVGAVRQDHPLAQSRITTKRYAKAQHIAISRRGQEKGPIDELIERQIATIVASYSAALALARATDLIATVPERQTGALRDSMHTFRLPFPAPELTISMLWHPRQDADPALRWFRALVLETCTAPRPKA